MNNLVSRSRTILRSFSTFVSEGRGIDLFYYQLKPAQFILESVRLNQGLTFVLDFPRNSGKDELLIQLKVYLLRMMNDNDRTMIEVNTSYHNQIDAIDRLGDSLHRNILTRGRWVQVSSIISFDKCNTIFLRNDDITDGRSIKADLLLIFNNANAIPPEQYDKINRLLSPKRKITRVICGVDVGEGSIISREKELAILEEKKDGIQRYFHVTEDQAMQKMQELSV